MVKQKRLVVGTEDIQGVRFRCVNCKAEVLQAFSEVKRNMPEKCPVCCQKWIRNDDNANHTQNALLELRLAHEEACKPVTLHLEFDLDDK